MQRLTPYTLPLAVALLTVPAAAQNEEPTAITEAAADPSEPDAPDTDAAAEDDEAPPVDGSDAVEEATSPETPIAAPSEEPTASPSEQEAISSDEQAELDATLGGGDHGDITIIEPMVVGATVHGFADFSYRKFYIDSDNAWRRVIGNKQEFFVGNLNLYFGARFGERASSLIEARLLFNPNGDVRVDPATLEGSRQSTQSRDSTEGGDRPLYWGGVEIERAQLDYAFREELVVRAGMWLTPYGIWNEDHGSIVFIPVARPFIVGDELFPERQVGLQLYGTRYVADTRLGYHLTMSNGRIGSVSQTTDFNGELSFGARVFAERTDVGSLELGLSAFGGRYTRRGADPYVDAGGFGIRNPVIEEYDELSLAADISWDIAALVVRGELIFNERAYTRRGRPQAGFGQSGLVRDSNRYGGYLIVGYRLPWANIMPFVTYETRRPFEGQGTVAQGGAWGLNVRLLPEMVFKLQYSFFFWPDAPEGSFEDDSLRISQAQLAWAF